jgi:predicted cobalt transporter CbtA
MQKSTMAYILAALMLSTAVIYFVAAAGESAEAGEGQDREQAPASSQDSDSDEAINSAAEQGEGEENSEEEKEAEEGGLGTQVETAFFTIVGLGYAGVGIWVLKDKGKTNTPYMIAIGGSIAMIGLYIASRTIDLPVVGLQEDVGTIDILSKVLQVGIIGLSAYMVNTNKAARRLDSRRQDVMK